MAKTKSKAKKNHKPVAKPVEAEETQVEALEEQQEQGPDLREALKRFFGFDSFKGDQEAIIRNLMQGNNTFVLMPTGGGKSLCYQLPSLLMEGTAIVISPLIALMKNQVDVITSQNQEGTAHYLNSSLNKAAIDRVRKDVREGTTKLLYVAPESLTKDENVEFLRTVKISFYAVDEAHCISEWGHDFRPEYRRIRPIINEIGNAPVIALTATATDKVRTDIKKSLGIVDAAEFKSSFNRPNLYYEVRPKSKNIDVEIIRFVKQHAGKSGIIYCLARKKVEELAEVLKANDIKAAPYHAGLDSQTRSETQDAFLMEEIDVIVATIAFGMGIDKPDVRFVIHYDIPKSLEGYYQETGRAGRDGGEGICLAFYSFKDLQKLEKFMQDKPVAEQDIGRQLLQETAAYAETSVCRRKMLLHYFGETYKQDNCHNCDNCLHPTKKIEAWQQLRMVLKVILLLKENFRADYITDFISGRETEEIITHHHQDLPEFGCGEDDDEKMWNPVIRQALLQGYLRKEVENYGLLKLTAAGRQFLKSPKPFMIQKDRDYDSETMADEREGQTAALDPTLQRILTDLRKEWSRKLKCPPYVIFQDSAIEQMATDYPVTPDELKNIQGVGEGKVRKPYAREFLDVIKHYCEENDIERQTDMRIRTVAKKSATKVKIIQNIDKQIALDDIALAQNMDFEDLLTEVEAIVYSGTKLNIDYFLEEVMDDDHVEDIYEYFRTSETDDLDTAIETLGGDITEDEVRLVRIKFISEMAN
jgi:ATP-dependent DNA helicase RecQ